MCYKNVVLALRCPVTKVLVKGEADITEDRPLCAEYMCVANYLNKKNKKIKKIKR